MRRKVLAGAGVLALAMTLVWTSAAMAVEALTLDASRTSVTCPSGVTFTVAFPGSETGTATIMRLPAGASEWTTAAVDVTSAVSLKPRSTAVYKAIADGVESEPVTVTVAARMLKPVVPGSMRLKKRATIKGMIAPTTATTATLTFYRLESSTTTVRRPNGRGSYRKTVTSWVEQYSRTVTLATRNDGWATWSTSWAPTEVGSWRIVVSYQDAAASRRAPNAYTKVRT